MARAPAELRTLADLAARGLGPGEVPAAGEGIAVAVSGGADSLAALHALRVLARPRGWRLAVATVDHGLRPESAADADFVVEHATALGLPVAARALDPAELLAARREHGLEGAARAARYAALDAAADQLGCRWIATGHTQDDQAETVLLQLLRGAGPDGLAAMAPVSGRLLRPLLGATRAQTRACCEALGLPWREDPSNADEDLLRNAVRARVLPLLESLRPGAVSTLARAAELARAEREWAEQAAATTLDALAAPTDEAAPPWQGKAAAASGGEVTGSAGGVAGAGPLQVSVSAAALTGLPLGLARRVVREAARRAGQPPPGAAATDAVLALGRKGARNGADVRWADGGQAVRERGMVVWPVLDR
jgi:tRNA(Ile)-lysidine synthase